MRRTALVSSAILLTLQTGCNPKKSGSASSEEPTQDPGQVNVDTSPEEETVDESKKVTGDDIVTEGETMQMSGKLAISGTGLNTVALPDKLLAFPIDGGQLKNVEGIVRFDIAVDGSFNIKIPKFDGEILAMQAVIRNGKVDRKRLEDFVKTKDQAGDLLKLSDEALLVLFAKYIEERKNHALTYVVVSMISSKKPEGVAKRAEEAATFAFVGLTAGGHNLFNLPVALANKDLALGDISITGDDARSTVDAAADGRFALVGDILSQLAATGATLKAVKNDYVNFDPTSHEYFHSSPFFAFEGDVTTVGADGFTTIDLGYDLAAPTHAPNGGDVGYKGYGLYLSGRHKDPSHPTVDLTTSNLCGDARRNFELFPPATIPTSGQHGEEFDATHPMSMLQTTDLEVIDNGSRVQCGTPYTADPNEFYYASGQSATDKELSWNWGSGGALLDAVPPGPWNLKIESIDVATFDLASAQPLTAINATDAVANVFVPQIKVTQDDNGFITSVDIKFSYYDAGAATPDFKPVTNLAALRRGVQELALEFDDYSGTREGNRITLDGAPDTTGVFTVDPATGEHPEPMLFPFPHRNDSDRTAEAISVSYEMYGNTYRFDFRVR